MKKFKVNLYLPDKKLPKEVDFPAQLIDSEGSLKTLAQALYVYQHNEASHLAKTKTRGEVKASTRKIYRQKGTGLARHGARSAPIFVKGGVAHGPKGIKRNLILPQKIKRKALKIAIFLKLKAKEIILVDNLSKIRKTKEAANFFERIIKNEARKRPKKLTLVLSKKEKKIKKVFENIAGLEIKYFKDLNAMDIYRGGIILFDKNSFSF